MNYYLLSAFAVLVLFSLLCFKDRKSNQGNFILWGGIAGLVIIRLFAIVYPGYLNIDESEWISLAYTLPECDIPYRCYDAHTTGFFNIYILKAFHFFNIDYTYASLRIFGLFICTIPSIILFNYALRNKYDQFYVNIGTGLLIHFFIFGGYSRDFLAYNSEHPIMLLMAIIYFCYTHYVKYLRVWPLLVAAVCIGVLPFTKLQSLPLAFAFAVLFLVILLQKKQFRHLLLFCFTGILPAALIYMWFSRANVMSEFWKMYIETNLFFLDNYSGNDYSTRLKIIVYLQRGYWPYYMLAFVLVALRLFQKRLSWGLFRNADYAPLLILLCSYYASFAPGTGFQHYNVIVILPLFLVIANIFSALDFEQFFQHKRYFIGYTIVLAFIALGYTYYSSARDFTYTRSQQTAPLLYIQQMTPPGQPICILGWYKAVVLQVESRRPLATRTAHNYYHKVRNEKLRRYYQKQYVEDLELSRPLQIVDPSDELSDTLINSVKEYVLNKYNFDRSIDGIQFYKRKSE